MEQIVEFDHIYISTYILRNFLARSRSNLKSNLSPFILLHHHICQMVCCENAHSLKLCLNDKFTVRSAYGKEIVIKLKTLCVHLVINQEQGCVISLKHHREKLPYSTTEKTVVHWILCDCFFVLQKLFVKWIFRGHKGILPRLSGILY